MADLAELQVDLKTLLLDGAELLLQPLELADVVLKFGGKGHGAGDRLTNISASGPQVGPARQL
jgi:hypothetical protein